MFSLQTLPALVELVQHQDLAVRVDACWALSFLAEGKDRQIQVSHFAGIYVYMYSTYSEAQLVEPLLKENVTLCHPLYCTTTCIIYYALLFV